MKLLYVLPLDVYMGAHTTSNGTQFKHVDLFHTKSGGHYIHLTNGMILAAIDFDNETSEDIWHGHPDVAPLPHPIFESKMPLADVVANPSRNLSQCHLDALSHIGIEAEHSVLDVHEIAQTLHPLVKVRPLR